MDFEKAKRIDRWVGIPLCYVLSVIEDLRKRFFPKEAPSGIVPQRVLFIGLSEMGSNILAWSAVEKARSLYPRAQIYFLVFGENKEAVALLGNIEDKNIMVIRNANLWTLFVDTLKFASRASLEKIDVVIDMELFSRFSSVLAYVSGAKTRVGFYDYTKGGLYRGHLHTHRVQFNSHKHISKNFLALASALAADPSDRPLVKDKLAEFDFKFSGLVESEGNSQDRLWDRLKRECPCITRDHAIVIINPDFKTRLPLRCWPSEKYAELAERLLADTNICVVSIGIGNSNAALNIKNDRHLNWIGKTSLRELVDLFFISKVLVSHDSGAVHLASVTGMAIIVMFGPETPLLYGPLNKNSMVISRDLFCSPCFSPWNNRSSPCKNNLCVNGITVDEVFEAVQGKLGRK